jgi:very-short-patch-repair endonuclease
MSDNPKNDSPASERPAWKTADPFVYRQIKDVRQKMRDVMTEAEKAVWSHIKSKKLGIKFRRQHVIGPYIVDFVALEYNLVIEIDGGIHKKQILQDNERTFNLNQKGYKVIRFTNEEVLNNIESVIREIKKHIGPTRPPQTEEELGMQNL